MKNLNIAAGIVTYNPDIDILLKLLESLKNQVANIIIVDNYSKNIAEIINLSKKYNNLLLIRNDHNYGIASALNQIFQVAKRKSMAWVLTLDDDSIPPCDIVEKFKITLLRCSNYKKIGIICPLLLDRNNGQIKHSLLNDGTCITSGSFTSVSAWEKAGYFDEWLFIDGVDSDFSYRLVKAGYRIIENPSIFLNHTIGHEVLHSFFGKIFEVRNYSPIRHYYQSRNYPVVLFRMNLYNYYKELRRFIKDLIIVLLYENDKFKKFIYMFKGRQQGLKRIRIEKKKK